MAFLLFRAEAGNGEVGGSERGRTHMPRLGLHHALVRRLLQPTGIHGVFPVHELLLLQSRHFNFRRI